MKKLLLFGGSFDPPHEGHRHLLEMAAAEIDFDRILIVPAAIPPHKERALTLSFEMRKAALKDLFGDLPHTEISDLEVKRKGKNYTIDTVHEVEELFPDHEIHLLMGADMFLSFKKWYRFEELLAETVLVVGPREEGEREQLERFRAELLNDYNCKGIILCGEKPLPMSSTYLRGMQNGLCEQVLAYINRYLDVDRAGHVFRVADFARLLAPRFGIDSQKAYLAGLLHDCTKCESYLWHLAYAKECGYPLQKDDLDCPRVLHQFTGALLAEKHFGVTDPNVLNAVRYHSTGRAGMSKLEKLILFSDSCEPGRNYPGVQQLRETGKKDLDAGVLAYLNECIPHIIAKKEFLHPLTVVARNHLFKEMN